MAITPKVSVCMITYNHEKYIREAIEGVLMQVCDFEVELIVANDCSTDKTNEVIQELLQNHPRSHWIKYINHIENKGIMPNFVDAMQQCQGKYIALCEGDDYWTDPLKLQKQVDFLEANADYNICFHKVKVLNNSSLTTDHITEKRFSKISNDKPTQLDLLEQGNFIHTTSVVFRNTVKEFPKAFYLTPIGDYFLHIILSSNGYIKRLDDVMGVYRSGVGIFSSLKRLEMNTNILKLQACVLSYLEDSDSKQVLLKKHLELIDHHNMIVNVNLINSKIAAQKSFKDLLKIFIYKLKYHFFKFKNKVS